MQPAFRILAELRRMGVEEMYEPPATRALAARLGGACEVGYSGGKCDVVFPIADEGAFWLEVKFAWTYMYDRNPSQPNGNYRKHLFHSSVWDATSKLSLLLGQPGVARIGFLLVPFYSTPLPLPESDIERFERVARLHLPPWVRHEEPEWVNPRNPLCRIRAILWERSAQNAIANPVTPGPWGRKRGHS